MSKILIIPDSHGRQFWRQAKEVINKVDKVVFLGDYLDPYFYEGISKEQAIEEFKEIIKFKEDNKDKVILLLGNHDCAYCFNFGDASRYDYDNEVEIKKLFIENFDYFRLFYKIDNYLFSHAGITNDWLERRFSNKTMDDFLKIPMRDIKPFLWDCSYLRGGPNKTGSIVWSDVREQDRESTYYQIFGHTQLMSEPVITDNYACLDVRKCFILNTETKQISDDIENSL